MHTIDTDDAEHDNRYGNVANIIAASDGSLGANTGLHSDKRNLRSPFQRNGIKHDCN